MDKKALKILTSTYWGAGGWKDDSEVSQTDFEYARLHGVMFDPLTISHDALVSRTMKARDAVSLDDLCRAFLASLSLRALHYRSAIASYMNCESLTRHRHKRRDDPGTAIYCDKCGALEVDEDSDMSVLNFERIKWGGVRHDQILYNMFDLERFAAEGVPDPTRDDVAIFKAILETVASSQPDDFPGALEKRLKDVVRSNANERKTLLEILACIGVLAPQQYDRPQRGKNDWTFVEDWRGEDGYDEKRVEQLFGKYLS